jgi:heat-inducible transcriptional repressor
VASILCAMTAHKPSDTSASLLTSMDQRARDVFKHLVDTYIATGEPVGSRTISKALPATLSPASIRNVMTDLEEAGLITSPHTSAGRVPTDVGLRFFVDALLQVGSLSSEERARIDAEVKVSNRQRKVEDVLGDATSLLSGLSHLTSVVLTPKLNARLKHIEFVNLSPGRALVILVTEDGNVENRIIDVPQGLPPSAFMRATNYLSAKAEGKTIAEVQFLVMREVETLRRELDDVSARLVQGGLAVWAGDENPDAKSLIVRGQAHLLEDAKATADLERIRKLFEDIESKRELAGLLGSAEEAQGVRIFIGAESRMFSLSGSSLIAAPFRNEDDKIVGVLGIIGPTRLNYARIIPMVDYTARAVGKLLS